MNKAEEIFKAWVSAIKPTNKEKLIAKDRLSVCEGCEFKKEVVKQFTWSFICGQCGCPLETKVYSPVPNACPKLFWYDVDLKNGLIKEQKENKTLF